MVKLILALLWIAHTHAESVESRYLQLLAHAQTQQQTESFTEAYQRLRIAHTACQIQLREQTAPLACYEVLALEKPKGMQDQIGRLDLLCDEATRKLRVHATHSEPYISKHCLKSLAAAQVIQAYREQETLKWSEN